LQALSIKGQLRTWNNIKIEMWVQQNQQGNNIYIYLSYL